MIRRRFAPDAVLAHLGELCLDRLDQLGHFVGVGGGGIGGSSHKPVRVCDCLREPVLQLLFDGVVRCRPDYHDPSPPLSPT